jgi:hypothetical protein
MTAQWFTQDQDRFMTLHTPELAQAKKESPIAEKAAFEKILTLWFERWPEPMCWPDETKPDTEHHHWLMGKKSEVSQTPVPSPPTTDQYNSDFVKNSFGGFGPTTRSCPSMTRTLMPLPRCDFPQMCCQAIWSRVPVTWKCLMWSRRVTVMGKGSRLRQTIAFKN